VGKAEQSLHICLIWSFHSNWYALALVCQLQCIIASGCSPQEESAKFACKLLKLHRFAEIATPIPSLHYFAHVLMHCSGFAPSV
jgi:hypothetical protein